MSPAAGRSKTPTRRRAARRAVVVGGVRTPFAKAGGALERLSAVDLGLFVLREALARTRVPAAAVQQVVMGCVGVPTDAANPARVAAVRAGLPHAIPALTVQRNCASGMEAVVQAAQWIESGQADVVLCGGMESMSNYGVEYPASFRRKLGRLQRARGALARARVLASLRPSDLKPELGLIKGLRDPTCGLSMGQTAEVLARELGIDRAAQDAFAVRSHQRAAAAADGALAEESCPVIVAETGAVVARDDAVRPGQSLEALGRLRPVFERRHGTVTAGNACGITDGACALVLAESRWAREHARRSGRRGRTDMAVRAWATAGVDPKRMGLGPTAALPRALERAGWTLDELGLLEINEAFAAQVLACLAVLEDGELMRRHADWPEALGPVEMDRLNVNGGAIALGHPVGVSGARLVLTLAAEMERRGVERGAATLCVGGGQGQAVLLEG